MSKFFAKCFTGYTVAKASYKYGARINGKRKSWPNIYLGQYAPDNNTLLLNAFISTMNIEISRPNSIALLINLKVYQRQMEIAPE